MMLSHKTTQRVRYADTDKMGFVYHANYLRWFEAGRSELFRHMGLSYKEIEARGVFLPLSEAHCRFKAPSQYDDLLIIETSLDMGVRGSMKFNYKVYSADESRLLAHGYTKHACVDASGRVIRPPDFILAVIAKNRAPA